MPVIALCCPVNLLVREVSVQEPTCAIDPSDFHQMTRKRNLCVILMLVSYIYEKQFKVLPLNTVAQVNASKSEFEWQNFPQKVTRQLMLSSLGSFQFCSSSNPTFNNLPENFDAASLLVSWKQIFREDRSPNCKGIFCN